MGKISILSLVLLFSMLFHANGNRMQPENINETLHTDSPVEEAKKWYTELDDKVLVTTELKLFFYAIGIGSDPNQVEVAQNNISTVPSWFGMVQALDYPLTAELDMNSEFMGYCQGFFLESSKEEFSMFIGMNLLLTKYSNSTLSLMGKDSINDKYRELSIVGGTGHFRLATGTAIMYSRFHITGIGIVELNIFVRHYLDKNSSEVEAAAAAAA